MATDICRAHRVVDFHRIFSFVNLAFLKAGAVAVTSGGCSARSIAQRELVTSGLYTTLADSTLRIEQVVQFPRYLHPREAFASVLSDTSGTVYEDFCKSRAHPSP